MFFNGKNAKPALIATPRGRNCDPGSPTDPPSVRNPHTDEASTLQVRSIAKYVSEVE